MCRGAWSSPSVPCGSNFAACMPRAPPNGSLGAGAGSGGPAYARRAGSMNFALKAAMHLDSPRSEAEGTLLLQKQRIPWHCAGVIASFPCRRNACHACSRILMLGNAATGGLTCRSWVEEAFKPRACQCRPVSILGLCLEGVFCGCSACKSLRMPCAPCTQGCANPETSKMTLGLLSITSTQFCDC